MNYHDRGYGDIRVAKLLITPAGNPTNDESMYDIAAYHVQQAIEKELKHILHDVCGVDDTTRSFKTHSIPDLVIQIEEQGIGLPESLMNLADEIGDWEAATRYSGSVISNIQDIREAISVYEEFVEFVKDSIGESEGEKECTFD